MFGLAGLTMDDCLPAEPAHLPIPTPLIPLRLCAFARAFLLPVGRFLAQRRKDAKVFGCGVKPLDTRTRKQ